MEDYDTAQLKRRMNQFEKDLSELRSRVSSLEGVSTPSPTPAEVESASASTEVHSTAEKTVAASDGEAPRVLEPTQSGSGAETGDRIEPESEPVVAKPVAPVFARPAAVPRPSRVKPVLQALHLLPPSGSGSGEAQLGAWWATRIGAIVFVIGIAFAGVYFSLSTPPGVKLAELAAVAIAVCFGGFRLEKKISRFGSVVFGAGLSLIYFTAYAAYAVPAVKMVDDPLLASALQIAAVALIFAAAIRQKTPTVAVMAVTLGYVSAFSALSVGFDHFALVASLALIGIAVVFRLRRGWSVPLGVAAVLHPVLTILVAFMFWDTAAGATHPAIGLGFVAVGFIAVLSSLLIEHRRTGEPGSKAQRWIQTLNTSFSIIAGYLATAILLPSDAISWYFFAAGTLLAAIALFIWRTIPLESLFGMYAVKASALVALGAATEWGSRTRWVALTIEAFVLLLAARRTRRPVVVIAAAAVWITAALFHARDLPDLQGLSLSPGGLMAALFAVATAGFWLLLDRTWTSQRGRPQIVIRRLFAVVTAVPAFLVSQIILSDPWGGIELLTLTAALGALALVFRSSIPVIAGLTTFIFSQIFLHTYDPGELCRSGMWINMTLSAVIVGLVGLWAAEPETRWPGPGFRKQITQWRLLAVVMQLLALAAVSAGLHRSLPQAEALAAIAVVATLVVLAGTLTHRPLTVTAGILSFALGFLMMAFPMPGFNLAEWNRDWLWIPAAATLIVTFLLGGKSQVRAELGRLKWFNPLVIITAAMGVVSVTAAALNTFDQVGTTWSLSAAALLTFLVAGYRRIGAAYGTASVLLAVGLFPPLVLDIWNPFLTGWNALISTFVAAMALATLPILARRLSPWLTGDNLKLWTQVQVATATICLIRIAIEPSGPWASYGSIVWATGGISLFAFGLFLQCRSHRIAGLITLALCIPRIFMVDISSNLYRIAAFVVLGIVLLWVGFSYHRFRHLIEDDKPDAAPEPEPDDPS